MLHQFQSPNATAQPAVLSRPARRAGGTRLIVLGGLLLLAAGVLLWMWSRPATQPTPDEGRSIGDAFLSEIRDGHPSEAWKATTAEFKSARGREAFVREIRPLKYLREPLEFVSSQFVTVQDQPRMEVIYRAPTGELVRLVLNREESTWKVDRWLREPGGSP